MVIVAMYTHIIDIHSDDHKAFLPLRVLNVILLGFIGKMPDRINRTYNRDARHTVNSLVYIEYLMRVPDNAGLLRIIFNETILCLGLQCPAHIVTVL